MYSPLMLYYRLLVILAVVSLIKLVAMLVKERRGHTWAEERNLDWYRRQHGIEGEILCHQCSGRNVAIREASRTVKEILNSHVCATCGAELYRSKTPKKPLTEG